MPLKTFNIIDSSAGGVKPAIKEGKFVDKPSDVDKVEHQKQLTIQRGYEDDTLKPINVHVFLKSHNTPSAKNVNTANVSDKTYVFIGNGFASISNHASLLKSNGKRSKNLKECKRVLHVGFPDPWTGYVTHNMNQEPELNVPPAYGHDKWTQEKCGAGDQPGTHIQKRWLSSKYFAKFTQDELEAIKQYHGKDLQFIECGVTNIGDWDAQQACHEVVLHSGTKIKAHYIDISSGVGQQRLMKPIGDRGIKMPFGLWWDYLNPPLSDESTRVSIRKVFSAEMFVRRSVLPKAGARVLVTGGNSPAAIQAMEHALDEDGADSSNNDNAASQVVVLASGDVKRGFPGIARLDYHACYMDGTTLLKRHGFPKKDLRPQSAKVLFCEGFSLKSVEETLDGSKVVVTFETKKDKKSRFVSLSEEHKAGEVGEQEKTYYAIFDQVVLSSGRERHNVATREGKRIDPTLGSTGKLMESSGQGFSPIEHDGIECVTKCKLPLALKSDKEGAIRLLGAAALNNHRIQKGNRTPTTPLEIYEASLPCQARVAGEGVCLAAVTIAYANEFFGKPLPDEGKKINTNANSATLTELQALLKDDSLGKSIYYLRAWRIAPFTTHLQLANAVARYDMIQNEYRDKPTSEFWIQRTSYYNDDDEFMKPAQSCPYAVVKAVRDRIFGKLQSADVGFFYETRKYPEN